MSKTYRRRRDEPAEYDHASEQDHGTEYDAPAPSPCPACGSDTLPVLLGELGTATWVRCRDCGWDYRLREDR
jgi:hypothetical protein